MRWFLRSAITAASLSSVAPVALAQPEPPPMVPPVNPLPDEKPRVPATGFAAGLPRPWQPPAAPTTATASLAEVIPASASVSAASGPKPAPVELVQHAIPTNPSATALRTALSPVNAEPPLDRPDHLPPLLPDPPADGTSIPDAPLAPPLPEIPDAPPTDENPAVPAAPAAPVESQPALDATSLPPETCTCPTERLTTACDPLWRLFPQDRGVRARGWLDAGIVYNSSYPDSKFNGPYNSIDRSAEPMFNQAYLIIERPRPTDGALGAGFRVDALFGYDHFLGQSRGFEVDRDFGKRWNGQYYGLAIPQAYAEVGDDVISLKLGHFYSTVGYEVLPAVGNFFYSRAYSYQFGQPITHWGGIVTTQLTQRVEAHAGLVNGWDTLVGRANNVNFIGGLKFTPHSNRWWTSFALVTGDEQNNLAAIPGVIGTDGNRTRYSFLFGLLPGGPCGRWEYVFHHYYGWQENGTPQRNFARWYGIDQYVYYRASKSVRWGGRFEWFRDEDGTRVGLNRPANPNKPPLPGNYFSLTGGLNYTPVPNLLVRPELRWDFTSDTIRRAFNDGRKNNQLLLACDVIWQF